MRGQNNLQGACDMGALPNVFSGYQPVTDETVRRRFAELWGVKSEEMVAKVGLPVTTMIEACGDAIKALYIMGENPMVSDPNLNHVEEQLGKLDFLVVQEIFLTETAKMADVVLPGMTFAEKTGCYTNTERRVQLGRAVLTPPAGPRQDAEIIAEIARRMGAASFPSTPEALFAEIRELTPSYHGITYERMEKEHGLRWPCPSEDHPGTPILHIGKFARGKGLLSRIAYRPSTAEPDAQYPMRLSTGRLLQHFHTGSMTRRAPVLDGLVPQGMVEIHPADASRLKVKTGENVRVFTRRGMIETQALVTDRVSVGSLFIPFHFAEAAANRLTIDALDPIAKIPEYKVCAARMEKAVPCSSEGCPKGESNMIGAALRKRIEIVAARYPMRESALLPAIAMAQQACPGHYVAKAELAEIAQLIGVSAAKAYGVQTYYTLFNTRPVGTYHLEVDTNVPALLAGTGEIMERLQAVLGIRVGETTTDERFTLSAVEDLGLCGTVPVIQINDRYYENITVKKTDRLVQSLRRGEMPGWRRNRKAVYGALLRSATGCSVPRGPICSEERSGRILPKV